MHAPRYETPDRCDRAARFTSRIDRFAPQARMSSTLLRPEQSHFQLNETSPRICPNGNNHATDSAKITFRMRFSFCLGLMMLFLRASLFNEQKKYHKNPLNAIQRRRIFICKIYKNLIAPNTQSSIGSIQGIRPIETASHHITPNFSIGVFCIPSDVSEPQLGILGAYSGATLNAN